MEIAGIDGEAVSQLDERSSKERHTMRPVRYNVAASLDGYIAGPNGEYDWIPQDPAIDFEALFARVDTYHLGRKSYELFANPKKSPWPDARVYVFSRTLDPADHPKVTVVSDDAEQVVAGLRAEEGDGEIWLWGGVPLLAPGETRLPLSLTGTREYPSGMITLTYEIAPG
jgi:hypothetical protein